MLCEYFKGRTLEQVTTLAVERLKRDRAATKPKFGGARSTHTVNSELTTLSGALALAVRAKLIRENPCSAVSHLEAGDALERRLPPGEEGALLESASAGPPFPAR